MLVAVMDGWKDDAAKFVSCNATSRSVPSCSDAVHAFQKSCSTVTQAIVSGSSGNRDDVQEYMADICSQGEVSNLPWLNDQCFHLKNSVENGMVDASFENRMHFDSK